jgi:hypothetical protein
VRFLKLFLGIEGFRISDWIGLRRLCHHSADLDVGILEKLSLELGSYLTFFRSSPLERTRDRQKSKANIVDSR